MVESIIGRKNFATGQIPQGLPSPPNGYILPVPVIITTNSNDRASFGRRVQRKQPGNDNNSQAGSTISMVSING